MNFHQSSARLRGRRVTLRPLQPEDYDVWHEVRTRAREWLVKWEPRPKGAPYPNEDRANFTARCAIRDRERHLGTAFGFGVFIGDRFAGEINVSSVQRGAFQSCYVGYWIDEDLAGNGYIPESCGVLFRFIFEELGLHRIQISILPRNAASRAVVRKLGLRGEGIAVRYLEIDGVWEDHVRYAITSEEWEERKERYIEEWIEQSP